MKIEVSFEMKRTKEGYDSRLNESLGGRRGAEQTFRESLKSRRNESKGMEGHEKNPAYSGDFGMDDKDKERFHHHMMSAHHKFMSQHHKRKMYKNK